MSTPAHDDIIRYFTHIFDVADKDHTLAQKEWRANEILYLDKYEFKEKISWQTKIKDPIVDNLIVRMTNFFSRILISADNEYFAINHKQPSIATGFKEIIKSVFRDIRFPLVFSDAFKMALLTAPYITKIHYRVIPESYPVYNEDDETYDTVDRPVGRTVITPINPHDLYLDPDGDDFIIENRPMHIHDFVSIGQANDWSNIQNVVLNVLGTPDTVAGSNFRPKVDLHYVYTKALTAWNGKVLDTDVCFIVANKKYVVYYAKNLLPKGQFPYVVSFPMKSLAGRYGRGYISKLREIILSYMESINLIMDSFSLSTLGAYEVVEDNISSGQAHLFRSIVPGRVYPVKQAGTLVQAFRNPIDPLALNVAFMIDRLIQNRSFQNEFFQGQPTQKGRPTASEIATKTQESMGFFTDIASEIERSIIEPTLELTLATESIYLDHNAHVDLTQNISSTEAFMAVRSLSFSDRINALREASFEARGISGKVLRLGNFNKLIQILNVLGNIPQAAQAVDVSKLVNILFSSLDMSPDDLLNLEALIAPPAQPSLPPELAGAAPGVGGGAAALPEEVVQGLMSKMSEGRAQ